MEKFNNLKPKVLIEDYVFCNFPSSYYGDHTNLKPIASFNEKEGLTLVIEKETAELNNLN